MSETVKLGMVGCGVIAQRHLKHASGLYACELAAVCDVDEKRVRATAEKFGIEKVFTDAEALIADPGIDAVILALPTCFRRDLGLAVLRSGKHLLTEKPVAMNAAEVAELIVARGDRVAACCSSRMSHFRSARAAAGAIADGKIGRLREVHVRAVRAAGPAPAEPPPAWRLRRDLNGGGILVNWGSYDFDFVFTLTGWNLRPKSVFAQTWTMPEILQAHQAPGSDAETHVAAQVACADGVVFRYERAERFTGENSECWQFVGDRGSIRLDMTRPMNPVYFNEVDPEKGVITKELFHDPESREDGHLVPVKDFIESIREGRRPATDLERSLLIARLTDGIFASAESGGLITLE